MLKILLLILAIIMVTFVVVEMYCLMVVAGRSDENENNDDNTKGNDEMFRKKKICPKCKTGKECYELDKHSGICPYIGCWENGECHFFTPIEKSSNKGAIKSKNKVLH